MSIDTRTISYSQNLVADSRGPDIRRRLLDELPAVVRRIGYVGLTVEALVEAANVSRASFYQYFVSADDCFWHAYRRYADELVRAVEEAVRDAEIPALAGLHALVDTAAIKPDVASLLMREGLSGGAERVAERNSLVSRVAQAITSTGASRSLDLPARVLTGGVFRFLSMRLADGASFDGVLDDLERWACTFAFGPSEGSRHAMFAPNESLRPNVGDGQRPRCRRPVGSQRERIIMATSQMILEKGCRQTTVSDIVRSARVSRRTLYNLFERKSGAFLAAYEEAFQKTLAACAPAFFSQRDWPERVWSGAEAFTLFLAREPSLAHIGFVECYALGPAFASRVHDTQLAFTVFLEDGYRQRPEAQHLPRACSDLTATTIFEAGYHATLAGPAINLRALQPLAVYVALTPFIGRNCAAEFVRTKVAESRAEIRARRDRRVLPVAQC